VAEFTRVCGVAGRGKALAHILLLSVTQRRDMIKGIQNTQKKALYIAEDLQYYRRQIPVRELTAEDVHALVELHRRVKQLANDSERMLCEVHLKMEEQAGC